MLKQENCNCSEPLISFSTNGVLNSYNRYTLYRDKWLIHFNSRGYYSRGFLKFLKSLDSYREYGKLKNYLYVVAKNTIRDFQRKKYEITEEPGVEASCDGALDNIPLQIDIWREIQMLDPLDKELIILRYYQNFKVKDIAQIVNIPPSTVGYKIKKIEKILKNRLGDIGYER